MGGQGVSSSVTIALSRTHHLVTPQTLHSSDFLRKSKSLNDKESFRWQDRSVLVSTTSTTSPSPAILLNASSTRREKERKLVVDSDRVPKTVLLPRGSYIQTVLQGNPVVYTSSRQVDPHESGFLAPKGVTRRSQGSDSWSTGSLGGGNHSVDCPHEGKVRVRFLYSWNLIPHTFPFMAVSVITTTTIWW